ncbi:divalent cation tolerance protein [Syntrophus gentianae]|uniref:Divalent cation tolerance protein n=1 Tax=Syntrophus gentianae TaxID=43775 RepID=A0A1H7UVJ1_9BACT|nr:divalent-cation tolerance protein CutA [Syntrophus gentianae]SEM00864.1 divalent cation tolerance protein [Syntrophus gentianae]
MEEYVQVFTTVNREKEGIDGRTVAKALVEKKLAACVQISPMTSVYRWEGQIETEEEWRIIIKTRKNLCGDVEKVIRDLTSYVVSEFIITPIIGGSTEYMDWMEKQLLKK